MHQYKTKAGEQPDPKDNKQTNKEQTRNKLQKLLKYQGIKNNKYNVQETNNIYTKNIKNG